MGILVLPVSLRVSLRQVSLVLSLSIGKLWLVRPKILKYLHVQEVCGPIHASTSPFRKVEQGE